ncbi:hypothetical protein [Tenacibaculum xiamenense]|uniref:hypothetical protein n=1 Tax=Tenacibaculum xiamenense TaxID=1261553 RepID=UPI00389473DD
MSILKKIQQPLFWKNVAKVAIPFFIVVTIFSLVLNSSKDIFSGNFNAVYETNFSNGKWINFWGFKVIFSLIYGVWITNKKMA